MSLLDVSEESRIRQKNLDAALFLGTSKSCADRPDRPIRSTAWGAGALTLTPTQESYPKHAEYQQ